MLSSLAARNTRMAISLRLATRIFLIGMRWDPRGRGRSATKRSLAAPWLFLAQVTQQMRHVVTGMRGGPDDLLRGHLPRLGQRPQRGRARAGPAIGQHRTGAPLERALGVLDHL